ncbi:MAG: hypothetical protein D6742_20270 [Cyanobacteria bacterium J069]|nr:MAG: hypothetical protein D6742_20270 [Cyanobacteria bacterium J069]
MLNSSANAQPNITHYYPQIFSKALTKSWVTLLTVLGIYNNSTFYWEKESLDRAVIQLSCRNSSQMEFPPDETLARLNPSRISSQGKSAAPQACEPPIPLCQPGDRRLNPAVLCHLAIFEPFFMKSYGGLSIAL